MCDLRQGRLDSLEAGLEEIEMCDAGLAGVELRACEHNNLAGFKSMAACLRAVQPCHVQRHRGQSAGLEGSDTWAARSSSPGPVPLGPASALSSMGFDWLSILAGGAVMERSACTAWQTFDVRK